MEFSISTRVFDGDALPLVPIPPYWLVSGVLKIVLSSFTFVSRKLFTAVGKIKNAHSSPL